MPKSFDPTAQFPTPSLSSAGSEALTFSQCLWNEGWGSGSLLPLPYLPNLKTSLVLVPVNLDDSYEKNEDSVKVAAFDQEGSLLPLLLDG